MSLIPIYGAALWYSSLSSESEEDPMTEEAMSTESEGGAGDTSGKTYLYYVAGDKKSYTLLGIKCGIKNTIGSYRPKSKAIEKGNSLIKENPGTYAWKTGYGN